MRRFLLLASLVLLFAATVSSAWDFAPREPSPARTWQAADLSRFSSEWVHMKFVEGSNADLLSGRFVDPTGPDLAPVNAALARADVAKIIATFSQDRATARAWKASGEAASGQVGPDLSLWFSIRVRGGAAAVAALINDLNACAAIEIAHPEPIVELAAIVAGDLPTPDFTGQQGYLYNPPQGLDAPAAWAYPGGTGSGGQFIDVELAWSEDHEDFPFARLFHVGGAPQSTNPDYEAHGTAVLGEVIGQQNGYGVNGFAPDLAGYGVVAISLSDYPTVPVYFQEAVDHLATGDVWLIELQMYPPGRSATPMEWLQVNYDVIWTSVWARDIICIEAGANGSQNLDDPSWGGVFDRNVRDSGAIMVGAGTPTGLVAESFTNYGSRMDVHAWGSSIVTTGYGDLYNGGTLQTRYTAFFGGTSGASPMVAGSALCLQGIARSAFGAPLSPIDLRTVLHDTGTPQQGTRLIGPRPDLGAAALRVLESASAPAAVPTLAIESGPNPFTESIELYFDGLAGSAVRVAVFDVTGRRVRALANAAPGAGRRLLLWDGRNDAGDKIGAGVYFFRLDAPGFTRSVKVQKVH